MIKNIVLIVFTFFSALLRAQTLPTQSHNSLENADSLVNINVINPVFFDDDNNGTPFFVKEKILSLDSLFRCCPISDIDYSNAADLLGVDIAILKAVIEIETGRKQKGFTRLGVPIINFDKKIFLRNLEKENISSKKFLQDIRKINPKKLSHNDYNWEILHIAQETNATIANESTFWGMFQIGGFNWKNCNAKSIDDFVYKMCYSEQTQLQLFVEFLLNNQSMHEALQRKDWHRFAYLYNGPKYRIKGYHTKLAHSHKRFLREESKHEK